MESERPEKKLRLETEADKVEENLRLKERVRELETLLEEGKKEMEKEKSKFKEEKNKVSVFQRNKTNIDMGWVSALSLKRSTPKRRTRYHQSP